MFWRNKERRTLRDAREFSRGARKTLRVQRDLIDPIRAREIAAACDELDRAVTRRDTRAAVRLVEKLDGRLQGGLPRRSHPSIRENVEVFLVAALVAMGVRTFFLQPFKIPTGSMQPSLYGIHQAADCGGRHSPVRVLFDLVLFGTSHKDSRCTVRGDHIFVDKVSYHFRKPRRGEVVVFDTAHVAELSSGSRGKFYIKRLIGLEHDRIQIQPPHVLVNGQVLDSRPAFERIYSQQDGYSGYVLPDPRNEPRHLQRPSDVYEVPTDHLFVLGDNSPHSLDGRFWGSFPQQDLVGRAIQVYWPFSRRLGPIQ